MNRIDKLISAARRLDSFSNDMLVIAKTQADKLILNRTEVDIKQLVQTVEHSHVGVAESREIKLEVVAPAESHCISVDENLFQRVLDNLLSNAIKFSPKQSNVRLQVSYLNGHNHQHTEIRIQVIDEGPGIPADAQQRIFQAFEIVQLKEKGVRQIGLGLAFCKMVMDAHNGRIYVESNQPHGSIFTIEL